MVSLLVVVTGTQVQQVVLDLGTWRFVKPL